MSSRSQGQSSVDIIPPWTALWRTLQPLRTISNPALWGPFTRAELLDLLAGIQCTAQASSSLQARSEGVWQMERLGYSYCRSGEQTLADSTIPRRALPILHIGLGVTASERSMFISENCLSEIERQAHPLYREFAYEAMGAMWTLYADRRFQAVFRAVSKSDLARFELPSWSAFASPFAPEIRRLISHGLGRTLYFQHRQVTSAIEDAVQRQEVDTPAATQGVAFAYALLNYQDFDRVTDLKWEGDPVLDQAFEKGLIYAMAFLSWTFPGFVNHLNARNERQDRRRDAAKEILNASIRLGRMLTFDLPDRSEEGVLKTFLNGFANNSIRISGIL